MGSVATPPTELVTEFLPPPTQPLATECDPHLLQNSFVHTTKTFNLFCVCNFFIISFCGVCIVFCCVCGRLISRLWLGVVLKRES